LNIKIAIVDDNKEYVKMLEEYISTQQDMETVGVAYNGKEALEMINDLDRLPDVILMDVIMPYWDGFAVMEKLISLNLLHSTKVILMTALRNEDMMHQALSLGAAYYVLKPIELSMLVDRIRDVVKIADKDVKSKKKSSKKLKKTPVLNKPDINQSVSAILNELSIPPHIKGYHFLREAIIMGYEDYECLSSMTKIMYPQIAIKFSSTMPRVERAIRHSIEVCWNKGGHEKYSSYLNLSQARHIPRPTNSEFIAAMADYLKLHLDTDKQ